MAKTSKCFKIDFSVLWKHFGVLTSSWRSIIKIGDIVACYQSRWAVYNNSLSPLLSLRCFSKHVLYVLWRLCLFFFRLRVFLEWSSIVRVLHGFAAVNVCHGFHDHSSPNVHSPQHPGSTRRRRLSCTNCNTLYWAISRVCAEAVLIPPATFSMVPATRLRNKTFQEDLTMSGTLQATESSSVNPNLLQLTRCSPAT